MNKNKRAEELLDKYNTGQASADERAIVETWYRRMGDKPMLLSDQEVVVAQQESWLELERESIYKKVSLWPRIAAAAVVLVVLSLGLYLFKPNGDDTELQLVARESIMPGRNGATLTLADGKKIYVADALAGRIASDAGVKITKTTDGKLVYEVLGNGGSQISGYNTLSTTVGEQIQVKLLDGSLVYLNAQSSLRYPASFAGKQKREVELTGEGYFQVAKDKLHPFLVSSKGQQVEVLGTHFNIAGYADEGSVKTTLVEGSVRVSRFVDEDKSASGIILKPDEQASFDGKAFRVKEVDADEIASWKNGNFAFNSEPLGSIMRKAERWYGVEVEFQDDVEGLKLTGSVSRFDNISGLLKTLEATEEVVFRVKDKKITVSKKQK